MRRSNFYLKHQLWLADKNPKSSNLVSSLWLKMHTLVALPPEEGGGASELAFPVSDWERGNL
ncbi:hypothetical protein [Nostoc sp.]|uniref:hypothetical protein n=1 Tax=Nostoc sp. TaxID=1180 RepID=UPI002FFB7936